jgi:hypothetical protein
MPASRPKAAKPPLPPDEQRERTIKGLRTQIRNLKADFAAAVGRANMPFATQSAIAKALHPDRQLSEAERDAAFKLFTAWKADKDKARRATTR